MRFGNVMLSISGRIILYSGGQLMLDLYPKISIVTPVFNQKEFIEDCIRSILNQNYPNLEYIIVDGGSTDGTTEIIKKYETKIHYWISEPDNGLYDALQKGFLKSTGDIMGWLNSDDILHTKSLFTIAEIFASSNDINWVQGLPTVIDKNGRVVYTRKARRDKYEFLLKEYHDGLFIQQESTYWRRKLWDKSGAFISLEYKIAGDYELWMRFFKHSTMYVTNALIGAFRYRGKGQLSKDHYSEYLNECDKITDASVNDLSQEEVSVFKRRQKIKRFPLMSRLIFLRGSGVKKKDSHEIYFDFNEYKFKKHSEE
jgi:glycosyltransferase involved in cell wall biosynthesis